MPRFNRSSALLLTRAIESGITSPKELSNIMGNAAVETGHFSTMHEGFGYRSAEHIVSQVPSASRRFTWDQIQAAIESKDPEQVAKIMYENRKDLGNTEAGDGWKYHGRGYFQYTGRYNYATYGAKFGVDLENNPDIAAEPEMAAKLALAYWKEKVPEPARLDARAAGKAINGGSNGAEARVAASLRWAAAITPELVHDIQTGKLAIEKLARRDLADSTVRRIQSNLNDLEITDARGQALIVDGIRGGPGSRTNEAIAAFRMQTSLPGQLSSEPTAAELLAATEAALDARQPMRRFNRRMDEFSALVPGHQPETTHLVNGMPDYLLSGNAPDAKIPTSVTRSTASPDSPSGPLQAGDRGPAVRTLQEQLHMLGAHDAHGQPLKPDGEFGHRTRQAVEQLQLWTGRAPTGVAGPGTLEALQDHARFAGQRQARGIVPGAHLADNLRPSSPDLADAAEPRPTQTPETARQSASSAPPPNPHPVAPRLFPYARSAIPGTRSTPCTPN